jgi:hypothetical protein
LYEYLFSGFEFAGLPGGTGMRLVALLSFASVVTICVLDVYWRIMSKKLSSPFETLANAEPA